MLYLFAGSLKPKEEHHSASITVQESTSIPTEVFMRLQIMLQLTPNPNIGSFFTNLRPVLLPVLWFDAQAAITDDIADQLKIVGICTSMLIENRQKKPELTFQILQDSCPVLLK